MQLVLIVVKYCKLSTIYIYVPVCLSNKVPFLNYILIKEN